MWAEKGMSEPFPAWSGESCGCSDERDWPCVECWDGFFGVNCQACPGAGISQ